jgi:DNA-binding response OmpR family regulator
MDPNRHRTGAADPVHISSLKPNLHPSRRTPVRVPFRNLDRNVPVPYSRWFSGTWRDPVPGHGKRILVIDDDPQIGALLEVLFSEEGCEVCLAASGTEGVQQFYAVRPHLVILDVMMPGLSGWETCPLLRRLGDAPIIFLTALDQDRDIVQGLDYGAVDYVTKPFSPRVLLACAKAALRQSEQTRDSQPSVTYDDGCLTVSLSDHRVLVRGQHVDLTPTEYRLLSYLLENAGRVRTYQQILSAVWGWEYRDATNYVHVYVRRLRAKIEPEPRMPRYLVTERGTGYRFLRQVP